MDSEEKRLVISALIMFIVYAALIFEKLFREIRKSRKSSDR